MKNSDIVDAEFLDLPHIQIYAQAHMKINKHTRTHISTAHVVHEDQIARPVSK